jgi:D-alanyl-lipoteichoic acid acyltransferase DltB (MBOAT superfamily)
MAALGLWHGAAWTFVLWGALHAAGRCLTGNLEKSAFCIEKIPVFIKRLSVFVFVTLAWILFRAASLSDAAVIFKRIFSTGITDPKFPLLFAGLILLVWFYQAIYQSRGGWILKSAPVRIACVVSMILYLLVFASPSGRNFIYFEF